MMSHLHSPRRRAVAGFAAASAGLAAAAVAFAGPAGAGIDNEAEYHGGNPTCDDLGYENSFKIEAAGELPDDGDYDSGSPGVETEGDADGFEVSISVDVVDGIAELDGFSANQPVSVVLIKAGPGANAYTFDPASSDGYNLSSDRDSISHITFCWNGEDDDTPPTTPPPTTVPDDDTPPTTAPEDECPEPGDDEGDEDEGDDESEMSDECDETPTTTEPEEEPDDEDEDSTETPAAADTAVTGSPNLTG